MSTETIQFGQDSGFDSFTLELDDTQNAAASSFQPGEAAYIRLYPAGLNPTITASLGNAVIDRTNLPREVTEYLVFARSDSASFSYPMAEVISYEWKGTNGGTPLFNETGVSLNNSVSGVLYVKYRTYYDRIALTCNEEARVLVEAWTVSRYGYTTVDYLPEERDVTVTVRDACTRGAIPSAMVYVDGELKGATDSYGRISLGKLRKGRHHISVVKAGYASTDSDGIANSYFEVID